MKNLVASFGLAAAGLLAALPSTVSAAFVWFDFSGPTGTNVNVTDFEFGFNLNGSLFQQGLGNPASTTLPANSAFTFSGQWIDAGFATPTIRTVYFVNPAAPTSVIGTFSYNYSTDGSFLGSVSGAYNPSGMGALPGGVNPGDIYLFDGSTYDFSNAFITMQVTTPAPGAAAVLGLAGLASFRRRR